MEMKLQTLRIENFKGIKSFSVDFGNETVIKGENGVGKTTVYDAFLWLLFGKDSTGRKDFGIRPLDSLNRPINGLIVNVTANFTVNGQEVELVKEHHEKMTKGRFDGYETQCWIDEVPKKVGEFASYIQSIIPEETFKLLTDTHYFNGKLHWKDRRDVLLSIAGDIPTPDSFQELLSLMGNRTVDEYKKVLQEQKKKLHADQSQIPTRIDELQKGFDGYAETSNVEQLQAERETVKSEIAELDTKRQEVNSKERERQIAIENVNSLKLKKQQREIELSNDTGNITALLNEKAEIEQDVAAKKQEATNIANEIRVVESELAGKKTSLSNYQRSRDDLRNKLDELEAKNIETVCHACGQQLPADRIKDVQSKKAEAIAEINKQGLAMREHIDGCVKTIDALNTKITVLNSKLEDAKAVYATAEENKAKRFEAINSEIANKPKKDPATDDVWLSICKEITEAENLVGVSCSTMLDTIEEARQTKQSRLEEINSSLAQTDRIKRDKARIEELKTEEKAIGEKIAEVDRLISIIGYFKASESSLITEAVNGMFKHVEFKLFDTLINGEYVDCCEAMLNGVPYSDMSTGQKIMVGVDIINVLSRHHGINVTLFIDNAESLTLPIESDSQLVKLFADEDVKDLTINTREVAA